MHRRFHLPFEILTNDKLETLLGRVARKTNRRLAGRGSVKLRACGIQLAVGYRWIGDPRLAS
jgi:hypothetical protein